MHAAVTLTVVAGLRGAAVNKLDAVMVWVRDAARQLTSA